MRVKESISVFFPAYNDAESIGKLVTDAISTLKKLTDDYEVIVVNDGSKDNTAEVLAELEKKYKEVKIITHEKNRGYGGALKSGFANASKNLVFYTDGDGQYDVKELTKLLPLIKNADLVNGWKIKRADAMYRKVLGTSYLWLVKILFNIKVKDVDCDFRLMRQEVNQSLKLKSNTGVICVEMMKKVHNKKFRIAQVGVHHYPRVSGKSQFFQVGRILKTFKGLGILWFELVVFKNE